MAGELLVGVLVSANGGIDVLIPVDIGDDEDGGDNELAFYDMNSKGKEVDCVLTQLSSSWFIVILTLLW